MTDPSARMVPDRGRARRHALMAVGCVLAAGVHGGASGQPSQGSGSRVRAEAVVRQFWDAFNRAAWDELDALVTPTYAHHPPGKTLNLAQFKAGGRWVHHGSANYLLTIESLIASDSEVAIRWTARGIHVGSYYGETPTQRELVVRGMTFHAVAGSRIAEDWEVIDFDGFKEQLRRP